MVEDIIFNLNTNNDCGDEQEDQVYKDANKKEDTPESHPSDEGRVGAGGHYFGGEEGQRPGHQGSADTGQRGGGCRIRNKEKLIDDLMFGEEDANKIIEQHGEERSSNRRKLRLLIPTAVAKDPRLLLNLPEDDSLSRYEELEP